MRATFPEELKARGPTAWEFHASHSDSEVLVAEARLPLLAQAVLFLDQVAQLGDVVQVGVRWNEGLALRQPVGQHRIEDFLQQGHILGLQALVRSLTQRGQEGLAQGDTPLDRVEGGTAGWHIGEAFTAAEVKLVQREVHTLRLVLLGELKPLRHEHWPASGAQLHTLDVKASWLRQGGSWQGSRHATGHHSSSGQRWTLCQLETV
mmetsp:Transcript_7104/g.16127  ORF Transcript_7104/g.16127 Transcript_7104/m.16127 type:complete len:206 (-) Transcript_7104:1759-2376(-)